MLIRTGSSRLIAVGLNLTPCEEHLHKGMTPDALTLAIPFLFF